jgi:hypothetical protein
MRITGTAAANGSRIKSGMTKKTEAQKSKSPSNLLLKANGFHDG